MGLIWNNECVLEKNKEPHKTSYSSTEATEMADNCFQVWHCSVNEFVLLCGQLTVSFLSFIFLSFCTHKHTHSHFLILLLFVFSLSGLHIYPLLGSLSFFFLLIFFSLAAFFAAAAFFFFTSMLYLFLLVFVKIFTEGAHNTRSLCFAAHYSQQIVYLDLGSLIQLCFSVTFQRHHQLSEAITKLCLVLIVGRVFQLVKLTLEVFCYGRAKGATVPVK